MVLDWTDFDTFPVSLFDLEARAVNKEHFRPFDATNETGYQLAPMTQTNTIQFSGYVVDRINRLESMIHIPEVDFEKSKVAMKSLSTWMPYLVDMNGSVTDYMDLLLRWDQMALETQSKPYPTGENHMTVYWSTLCASLTFGGAEQAAVDFAT
jgi:hypothetical protein